MFPRTDKGKHLCPECGGSCRPETFLADGYIQFARVRPEPSLCRFPRSHTTHPHRVRHSLSSLTGNLIRARVLDLLRHREAEPAFFDGIAEMFIHADAAGVDLSTTRAEDPDAGVGRGCD